MRTQEDEVDYAQQITTLIETSTSQTNKNEHSYKTHNNIETNITI